MADNFLASPIIPGTDIKNHEHKRLVIALVVVIIIAIVIGVVFWLKKSDYLSNNPSFIYKSGSNSQVEELDKYAVEVPATTLEKNAKELDSAVISESNAKKTADAKELTRASQK